VIPTPLALGRVRLARVARHESWFRQHYLHAEEERRAAGLFVGKRRVEFVAGRAAVKRAARRLGVIGAPGEFLVLPDEGARAGAPVLFDGAGQRMSLEVSISHGAGLGCAAAVGWGKIGLDVERIEGRLEGFREGAFGPGEVESWREALGGRVADDRVVTVAWCAKEALLKVAGLGLRAPLESHAARGIRWLGAPPAREAMRLDVEGLAWAEVETEELGVAMLGVATRGDVAMVVGWTAG
jgi:phosphopantetheinyl transferase (holo-ACP synthase)